jgi:hypothetical protein
MKEQRDYQRTRLYRSEWEIIDDFELLSLTECWYFVAETLRHPDFVQHFPRTFVYLGADSWASAGLPEPEAHRPNKRLTYLYSGDRRKGLKLRPGYRRRHAESCYSVITLPLWSRNKLTLLHELAHVCCWCDLRNGALLSSHGKEFAGVYLLLVEMILGLDTADTLSAMMLQHKVKVVAARDTIGTP